MVRERLRRVGGTRLRALEVSPGYRAHDWCARGHIVFVHSGSIRLELTSGRVVALGAGGVLQVGDGAERHRLCSDEGARLVVVDSAVEADREAAAEARLRELGVELPPPTRARGLYSQVVESHGLLWISGHAPVRSDGSLLCGVVGAALTTAEGAMAARAAGLAILSTVRSHLDSLDRVERVVRLTCMVRAAPDFEEHPAVADGLSGLMLEVFGERGRAARAAVGMSSLPFGIAVECDAVFRLRAGEGC